MPDNATKDSKATGPKVVPLSAPKFEAKPVYTTAELRAMFGVSDRTLQHYRSSGKLKAIRLGREVRYLHDDVVAFLTAQREDSNRSYA